jgi:O-antigen/teichoic acid export membrane protein
MHDAPKAAVSIWSQYVRSSMMVVIVRVAGIALQMLNLLVLSRLLPPELFGGFATAFALLAVIRVIGPLGFDQMALKGVFESSSDQEPAVVRLEDAFSLLMIVNVVFALALAGGAVRWSTEPFRIALIIVGIALPAVAASGILAGVIRSRDYNTLAQIPESIGLPAILLLFVIIGKNLEQATLEWCVGGLVLSAWLTLVIYWLIVWRIAPLRARFAPMRALRLLRDSASLTFALTLTAAASRLPIFLAAIVLGPIGASTAEVALRFGTLGTIITSSVATTFSPRFARAHSIEDKREAYQLLRLSAIIAGTGAGAVALFLIAIFPFLTNNLLPNFYAAAFPMLALCSLGTLVNATFGLASTYLFMAGSARTVVLLSLLQLLAIAALGVVLAQLMGPTGIGIALVVGAVIRDGGSMIVVRRMLRSKRA